MILMIMIIMVMIIMIIRMIKKIILIIKINSGSGKTCSAFVSFSFKILKVWKSILKNRSRDAESTLDLNNFEIIKLRIMESAQWFDMHKCKIR